MVSAPEQLGRHLKLLALRSFIEMAALDRIEGNRAFGQERAQKLYEQLTNDPIRELPVSG